jgi:CO dehydrogenase maturation factor
MMTPIIEPAPQTLIPALKKPIIVAVCGKGGVGKTTITALLLDELARYGYQGPVLAIDGDPATTLHLALGLPHPEKTLAQVRDSITLNGKTIHDLPAETTPAAYVKTQLRVLNVVGEHNLENMPLDLLSMGAGQGQGCYCSINRVLTTVIRELHEAYPLIVIDNEAGLEWVSRYRVPRVDYLVVVTTPSHASQVVSQRIMQTTAGVGVEIGEIVLVFNRYRLPIYGGLVIGDDEEVATLEENDEPAIVLGDKSQVRASLGPLVRTIYSQLVGERINEGRAVVWQCV